jgi:hypothetical protein
MIQVSSADLDVVASLGNSIHLAFFGISAGAAITCWVVLKTAGVSDPNTHAEFVMGLAGAILLTAYFGLRAFFDYRTAQRKLREIKGVK